MACDQSFVDHVCDVAGTTSISYRKMFGEYAIYLDGKVVAFACDNSLFLKPTPAGQAVLKREPDAPPYPGGRLHFRIDDALDDPPLLQRLLRQTADALPAPKPKGTRRG